MRVLTASCVFWLVLGVSLSIADGGISSTQRKAIQSVNTMVGQAGAKFAGGDFQAAGEAILAAIEGVKSAQVGQSLEVYQQLLPAMKRITKAHTLLQFEGVSLPPFRIPPRPTEETATAATETSKMRSSQPPASPLEPTDAPESGVSFTGTVASILSNRCGGCHIRASKGGFDMSSFASLMKGPPEGVVVFAGDTLGSRLIETIETGDMPRGGGKVPAAELALLKKWILEGATFDGDDPTVSIAGSPTAAMNDDAPSVEVQRSRGDETVSFAKDIAPILVNHCNGCHIDAMQARGGLRMDTFATLLRGGDSGPMIRPGSGDASLLIQKLRGMKGARMPAGGRPALPDETIQRISTWIDEGATLDGASDSQPLGVMSQMAWAASASDEEVSAKRKQLSEVNLQLTNAAGAPISERTTDHFYVVGTASEATTELVAELAESQIKMVRSVVSAESGEGFYGGRVTIFVMPRRYDYSEFAKMVESRSLPTDWSSHWQFDGVDAYVAMVATDRDDEQQLAGRLLAPLTALAVATRGGDVPRWLAEGVGAATAARTRGMDRDQRRRMDVEISSAVAAIDNSKKFLDGKMTPEQSDRIGAAIATALLDRTNRRNFDGCMRLLDQGKSFETAFAESFGMSTVAFVDAWIRWVRG